MMDKDEMHETRDSTNIRDISSPTYYDQDVPVAQSPSLPDTLSTATALARFEFEPNRGNEGTKVIMVEWQDEDVERHRVGSWQVSWPGKKMTFAAEDNPSDHTNRVYFLLPPGASVPPAIQIAYIPPDPGEPKAGNTSRSKVRSTQSRAPVLNATDNQKDSKLYMTVKPLPAIFTPSLGATVKASGRKGVLHTIWAKRRLQVLAREIKAESEHNLEGIALEIALAERQWIEQNFGVMPAPSSAVSSKNNLKLDLSSTRSSASSAISDAGVQSPRSPGGRRLTDKLKGLNVVTSTETNPQSIVEVPSEPAHPFSPDVGDMAIGSFEHIRGDRTAMPAPTPGTAMPLTAVKRIGAVQPPSQIAEKQASGMSATLSSIARGETSARSRTRSQPGSSNYVGTPVPDTDDLFAIAMGTRSPDEPRSPFSIQSNVDAAKGGAVSQSAFSRIKGVRS